MPHPIVIAVPKGRILAEALPILASAGIVPEAAFGDENSRALRFATQDPGIALIRVRAFDVATFVAHGAAQLGIVGSDVLAEFDYSELYAPVDLNIGHCRLSVAEPAALAAHDDPRGWSHVRVATKYPHVTARHFARRGVQAECVKLNGAMELAPLLGLAPRIVDLVSSGRTLKENGLVEVEEIMHVTSRLIVNRAAMKTRGAVVPLVEAFRAAVSVDRPHPNPSPEGEGLSS
jgi:ATP phosphoribosyltransferase